MRSGSILLLWVMVFVCCVSVAAGRDSVWHVRQATQGEVSGAGDEKPAPAPNKGTIVERELSGKNMSFSFTDDDDISVKNEADVDAQSALTGESIMQRELSPKNKSFGFTD